MSKVDCPYCLEEQDISHDDGFGTGDGETYQYECRDCEQYFIFTTSIIIDHEAEQAPCLNGSPHDFQPIHGAPAEYFIGRYRCSVCSEEKFENQNITK